MQRLTVHLTNVQKTKVKGKTKLFNTLSFLLKKDSEKEINDLLNSVTAGKVTKHYLSKVN